jgi:hypothetical protein
MPEFGQVIFKNKTWKLSWTGHHGSKVPHEIRIESLNKAFVDYALMYKHNGQIVYDWPERIPTYIKEKVSIAFYKGRK